MAKGQRLLPLHMAADRALMLSFAFFGAGSLDYGVPLAVAVGCKRSGHGQFLSAYRACAFGLPVLGTGGFFYDRCRFAKGMAFCCYAP